MRDSTSAFSDPLAVANYAVHAPRKVPGLADLHRMATLLLAEQASGAAHILVVGAGGGMELKAMAEAQSHWRFTGVDPSRAMLDLARHATLPFAGRVQLVEGTVDRVAAGPFDGATCLLTLHFLDRRERLHTLREVHRRLRPGAAMVVAHHAPPGDEAERWMTRSAGFAEHTEPDPAKAIASGRMMANRLPLLAPDDEEALLREAGFTDVALFYAAFSFRGWVTTAGQLSSLSDDQAGLNRHAIR